MNSNFARTLRKRLWITVAIGGLLIAGCTGSSAATTKNPPPTKVKIVTGFAPFAGGSSVALVQVDGYCVIAVRSYNGVIDITQVPNAAGYGATGKGCP